MRFSTAAAAVAVMALPLGAAASAPKHDPTIELPAGFEGEGVAVGRGNTFYAGSLADGRIARGNLHRRTSHVFVDDPVVSPAVGLKADLRHDLLWVAGGPTGHAAVYDLRTSDAVADLTLTGEDSFINDVAVTRTAAYFTNSQVPELYRVPVSATRTRRCAGDGPAQRPRSRLRAGVQPQRNRGHSRRQHPDRRQQCDGRTVHCRRGYGRQRPHRPSWRDRADW